MFLHFPVFHALRFDAAGKAANFLGFHIRWQRRSSPPVRGPIEDSRSTEPDPQSEVLLEPYGAPDGGLGIPVASQSNHEGAFLLRRTGVHVTAAIEMVVNLGGSANHAAIEEHVEC